MIALALTALLSFTDPQGDAYGDGSLQAPTASVNRTIGSLDITQFELYNSETLQLALKFASLTNPFDYPNGFSFPIIEVYIDNPETPGSNTLLPGSDMSLPNEAFWDYAFKLTGDTVQVFEASTQEITDITAKSGTDLSVNGDTITLQTSLARPEDINLYAIVGNYSPFTKTGWMPTSSNTSPWAYWSDTQSIPVVDVLASNFEQQKLAIQSGVIPPIEVQKFRVNPWFIVMFSGMALALLGVIGRFFVKTPAVETQETPVWYEETSIPSELMAAERKTNQQLNHEIQQEAEKLNQAHPETLHTTFSAAEESHSVSIESESPAPNNDPNKTAKSLSQDIFNVWVDDEVEEIDWSAKK